MELTLTIKGPLLFAKPLEKSIETLNSREFKTQMMEAIRPDACRVVLDLSAVEFLDSNALGSLISLLKFVANMGGKLVVCQAQDAVKRIFTITRLYQAIPLFDSEKAAEEFLTSKES